MPDGWDDYLRWNNCVRTRPPHNRDPAMVEIECCRPSVEADIEASKPVAIFGFGNVPLKWALRRSGITIWAGRRIPIRIGSHSCWYYPMFHPSGIAQKRKFEPRSRDQYGCDDEFAFAKHLENAFADIDAGLPDPHIWSLEEVEEGVSFVNGSDPSDVDRILDFIEECWEEEASGLDYETPCLRPYVADAKILTVGLAHSTGALAFPLHHKGAFWSDADRKKVNTAFGDFLHDAPTRKISFALPFEMEWSAYHYGKDCLWGSKWGDAQSQAYILDERQGHRKGESGLSLDTLCLQYFGFDLKALSNVDRKQLADTPVDTVLKYNALDAKFHRELWFVQEERLEEEELSEVYQYQVERAPTMVLSQLQGVPVNRDEVKTLQTKYNDRLDDIEQRIDADPDAKKFHNHYGHHYNPGPSSKDVGLLFRKLLHFRDLESGDEAALKAVDHPLAGLTVEWRKASKALSTYIDPCDPDHPRTNVYPDGLLHMIISICKVRTWRTSSEEPNIQNWPKRDEEMKEVRRIVSALKQIYLEQALGLGTDLKLVSFDYAGIQARNIAMESQDARLIQAFWDRYDIHTDWMEKIQKIFPQWADPKKLVHDKEYRSAKRHKAKNGFVFPTFFGAQARKTSAELGIEEWASEELREMIFDDFPDVLSWQEDLKASYFERGYVTGLSCFRRRAPVEQNQIINSPIQSDEAIIVCDAMARLSRRSYEEGHPAYQAMLEIHDDLTFLWPKKDIERNAEVVIQTMIDTPFEWAHCVPIEVEMSVGDNWAELKKIGAYASDTWKGGVKL
jgi:DNA polymerase I-like protein with 3'-5' exonuclease and polymerase domains